MPRRRALAAAVPFFAVPFAAPVPAVAAPRAHTGLERAIVRTINVERTRRALPGLRESRRLARVARRHSADQLRHGLLSHDGPDGTPFATRLARVTRARKLGETVAWLPAAPPAARIVAAWLASPGHRAQLLDPAFRRIGVGRRRGTFRAAAGVMVTADFASGRGTRGARG